MLLVLLGLLIRLIFGTWAEALILMGHEAAVQGQTALGRGWRQARQRLGPLIGFQLLALPFLVVGGALFAILFPFWLSMMKVLTLPPSRLSRRWPPCNRRNSQLSFV
ncbi:MAG: hypothetical protein R2867_20070 [Caldilineaceae bacterium]